jgi:hypothetical protein
MQQNIVFLVVENRWGKHQIDLFILAATAAIDNNNDGLIYTLKLHNPNRLTTLLIFH